MTKTIKKSLVCFLMFVVALMGVSAIATVPAKAADLSADANSFVAIMGDYLGNETTAILADETARAEILDAKDLYGKLTAEEKADASVVAAYNKFDAIWKNAFNQADAIINYHQSSMFDMIYTDIKYSMKARFDALMTEYNDINEIDTNEKAWIDLETENMKYVSQVEALFTAIENAAITANDKINDIEYFVTDAMVAGDTTGKLVYNSKETLGNATDALDAIYGESYKYASWDEAELKALTDAGYLANIEDYDNAMIAWQGLVDEANAVIAEIANVYATVNTDGAKSYKKNETAINNAKLHFDGLKGNYITATSIDVNDLQNLVDATSKTNLQTMVDGLKDVNDKIAEINGRIDDLKAEKLVDAENGIYTAECKVIIDDIAARLEETKNLDLGTYVVDNAATLIDEYDVYTTEDAAYKQLKQDIQDLKNILADLVDDQTNIVESYTEGKDGARDHYIAFVPNQKTEFDAAACNYTVEGKDFTNYQLLYEKLRSIAKRAADAAAEFDSKVNALTYAFAPDFIEAVEDLIAEYATLDASVQQAITTYEKLVGWKTSYDAVLEQANAWKTAVNNANILDGIVITDKEYVDAAMTEFATLENAYANIGAILDVHADYEEAYDTYLDAVEKMYGDVVDGHTDTVKGIVDRVYDVAALMDAIVVEEIAINDATKLATFNDATTAAKNAYEGNVDLSIVGLTADEKAYLQAEYTSYYENYQAALVNYAQYHVEALILAIGSIDDITIAELTKEAIEDAEEAYEELSDELKEKVRNYATFATSNQDPNLVDARAKFNEIAAELNAWIAEVKAIAAEPTAVDALVSVDLANVVALNEQYKGLLTGDVYTFNKTTGAYETTGTNVEDADVVDYLDDAYALLGSIQAKAFTLITGLTAEFRAIVVIADDPDFEPSTAFITRLENAENAYVALADSQKNEEYNLVNGAVVAPAVEEITDLLDAYGAFAEVYRYQKLVTDYAAAVDSLYSTTVDGWDQYVSENVPVMISTLKSIYEFSGEYQAVLQPSYDKLIEVETWVENNWANNEQWSEDPFNPVVTLEDYIAKQINDLNTILSGDRFAGIPGLVGQMQELVGFDYVVDDMGTAFPWDDVTEHVDGTIDVINAQIAEMEGKITALEDFAQATGDNVMQLTQDLRQQILALNELKAAYEAKVATIEGALDAVTQDIFNLTQGLTQYKGEVAGKFESVEGALDVVTSDIRGIIEGINHYKGQVAGQFSDVEYALDIITTDIRNITEGITQFKGEVAAMKADLESKIAALEKAIEDEETARKEADTAINNKVDANKAEIEDLLAAQVKKLNTTITIITVIFSVVMAGMIACTVILFLKRR